MADTALAMLRGGVDQNMHGGKLRPETKQAVVDLIVRLYCTWAISRDGSYDSERGCCDPYFAAEDGRLREGLARLADFVRSLREAAPPAALRRVA